MRLVARVDNKTASPPKRMIIRATNAIAAIFEPVKANAVVPVDPPAPAAEPVVPVTPEPTAVAPAVPVEVVVPPPVVPPPVVPPPVVPLPGVPPVPGGAVGVVGVVVGVV